MEAHIRAIVAILQHLVNDPIAPQKARWRPPGDVMPTAEIAGCFAFWAVVRSGASALWLAPGLASLALFAWLLTR
jgi:hypothetical protein